MKTLEELETFYNNELYNDIAELEKERRKVARNIVWLIIGGILLCGGAVAIGFILHRITGLIGVMAIIMLFIFLLTKSTKKYTSNFKEVVIRRIINFIEESLEYYPDSCISRNEYMSSKIFPKNPDRYRGDDLVTGKPDKTELRFSEVHSEYKTKDSKGRTQWHTIFKGIFFIADFNKNFNGETFVLPDVAEKVFGSWLGNLFQKWNPGRADLVKLEDPDFEKLFVVYSDDQIEARYILSTSLMRRITEYKNNTGKKIFLSFINNHVYVAISYGKNLFEPHIFKTLLDFGSIKVYYEDLLLALRIVEELNLNRRIWGKQ